MVPRLAGTAAGIGIFVQHFIGGGFAQIYGLLADGSTGPMMATMAVTATLGLVTALIPSFLPRPKV
jgi:MFS transporter, DHA1 family, multidrug resistance protein